MSSGEESCAKLGPFEPKAFDHAVEKKDENMDKASTCGQNVTIKEDTTLEDPKMQILKLPMENVLWMIGKLEYTQQDDSDEEDEIDSGDVWTICDTHKFLVGARTQRRGEEVDECVRILLEESMLKPLSWTSRRPKYISFRDTQVEIDLHAHEYGIMSTNNACSSILDQKKCRQVQSQPVTSCTACDRSGNRVLFITCPDCHSPFYCTKDCMEKDRIGTIEGLPGHEYWCDKMKQYLSYTKQLSKFPFTYAKETTSPLFDEQRYRAWQQERGVFGKGLWRREWSLFFSPFGGYYADLREAPDNDYVLPELNNMYLQEAPPSPPVFSLTSWADYVKWRKLDLDSPAPILMQWPLTLYHVITNLYSKHYPKNSPLLNKKSLTIHIVGVERELDMLPVFYELSCLLQDTGFDILLVGNEISENVDGKQVTYTPPGGKQKMTFTVFHGFYHNYRGADPDFVMAFNAGIAAYPSWQYTLHKLHRQRLPAFFTDYFHISCECSRPLLLHGGLGDISEVEINPFRSPVRRYIEEHQMPSYSNGFVFSLCYDGESSSSKINLGEFGEIL